MTPIESLHDVRLVTLIGVAINAIETLAILQDKDPETILAEHLYLTNSYVTNVGEQVYLQKLHGHYPLLKEAIK